MISRTIEITNKRGLHARASAKFVTMASGLPAKVEVEKDGSRVVGTSIMGLMMLGAAIGDTVTISASGDGAEQAVAALAELVESKFGGRVTVREITGFSNPLVKEVRGLREKKHRRASGRFLAEGLRILTEALDAGIAPLMLWRTAESGAHALVQRLEAAAGETFVTSADILSKLSGKDNPGSLVGVYAEFATPLASLDRSKADIWLVAQALRDPGNLGTMLRTGDAVGAGGLILIDDCTDPFSVEAVRASMGAIFTQAIVQASWAEFVGWLRGGPGQLVGTSLNTETDYQAPRYAAPTFVLTGNEAQGLPPTYEAECDLLVKMPMMGKADSLNAAVATAVMAYEVLNQRRAR